jgi:glycosyltransferase involved in cell wall biosynthesis
MLLTIFTPTYNRAVLLERLFTSLREQSFKNFEWIIVDDGSSDRTEDVVSRFLDSNPGFQIIYFKQENQGKHIAINKGVSLANGELFFIVDSDDYLNDNAIETIFNTKHLLELDPQLCGLVFHRKYPDGTVVGKRAKEESMQCSLYDLKFKYGIQGDKAEIFKTIILRKFPFPEGINEKFCPEALVMYKMSGVFPIIYMNKAIYVGDYLDGGLTSNIVKIRMKSSYYSTMYYNEQFYFSDNLINQIKSVINYYRFSFCGKHYLKTFSSLYSWLKPIGYLLHLKDKKSTK